MAPGIIFSKGNNYVIRSQRKGPGPRRVRDYPRTRRHCCDRCHAFARTQDRQHLQLDQQLNEHLLVRSPKIILKDKTPRLLTRRFG